MKLFAVFLFLPLGAFAAERVPWTTSRVTGSPEPPPPYFAEVVWPHLRFDNVLDVAHLPSGRRIFLVGRKGEILSLPDDLGAEKPEPVIFGDLGKAVPNFENLFGMTF
ncbi:MAG: hypothetical protein VB997_05860, partial [Opitutales bacterium]